MTRTALGELEHQALILPWRVTVMLKAQCMPRTPSCCPRTNQRLRDGKQSKLHVRLQKWLYRSSLSPRFKSMGTVIWPLTAGPGL